MAFHVTGGAEQDEQDAARADALARAGFNAGWNAAMEEAASTAEHLNGWGSPPQQALAEHIAKCIRRLIQK